MLSCGVEKTGPGEPLGTHDVGALSVTPVATYGRSSDLSSAEGLSEACSVSPLEDEGFLPQYQFQCLRM